MFHAARCFDHELLLWKFCQRRCRIASSRPSEQQYWLLCKWFIMMVAQGSCWLGDFVWSILHHWFCCHIPLYIYTRPFGRSIGVYTESGGTIKISWRKLFLVPMTAITDTQQKSEERQWQASKDLWVNCTNLKTVLAQPTPPRHPQTSQPSIWNVQSRRAGYSTTAPPWSHGQIAACRSDDQKHRRGTIFPPLAPRRRHEHPRHGAH